MIMKSRIYLNAMVLMVLAFVCSCSNEDILQETTTEGTTRWMITGQGGFSDDGTTRSVSMGGNNGVTMYYHWEAGEQVAVYNSSNTQVGTLTATPLSYTTAQAEFTGYADLTGSFTPGQKLTYYMPNATFDFTGQDGTLANISSKYDYETAEVEVKSVVSVGTDNHIAEMGYATFVPSYKLIRMKLKDEDGNWIRPVQVTIHAESGKLLQQKTLGPSGWNKTYGNIVVNLEKKDGMYPYEFFIALCSDTNESDEYFITAKTEDGTIYWNTGEANKWTTTYADGGYAAVTRTMSADGVDLGIEVDDKRILWAPVNVGATNKGDYGDYFAWGEVTPKTDFAWPTYKWCNGAYYNLTKYNTRSDFGTVDNKTVLDPEDDAAHVNMVGDWYMPTYDELNALLATKSNTTDYTWEWTTADGHNGYRITQKSTGNNIFLPAPGVFDGTWLLSAGSYGSYLSSSLNTNRPSEAWYLDFESDNASMETFVSRERGRSVRGVKRVKSKSNISSRPIYGDGSSAWSQDE